MRHSPRHRMLAMILAPAIIHLGCASPPVAHERETAHTIKASPRMHRERVMKTAWRGRSYHALLESLGPPRAVMTHPGFHHIRGNIVIYGVRDTASNCIDAFTVVMPGNSADPMVVDYFCR